jgi:L-asparaginase
VLVVLNDTIHAARAVTKTATLRLETFKAPDLGPLGYADTDGRVCYYFSPTRVHTLGTPFDIRHVDRLPRVDVVVSHVDADGTFVDASIAAGARGIVSAGTGGGHAPGGRSVRSRPGSGRGDLPEQPSRLRPRRAQPRPGPPWHRRR